MATLIPILSAWIEAGKPTREEIFQNLVTNQENINTDVENLKQTAVVDIIDVSVAGAITEYTEDEVNRRMPVYKAPVSASITSIVITLLEASTSGTLQVDVEKSIDNGANWSPLLTSPVELTGTTPGSVSGAVNFINAAAQDFNQNDLIRIRIPGTQAGQGQFHISVYGELA